METHAGKVIDELVDTSNGYFVYRLEIGYKSIDSIFRDYEGKKIKITIEEIEEDNG